MKIKIIFCSFLDKKWELTSIIVAFIVAFWLIPAYFYHNRFETFINMQLCGHQTVLDGQNRRINRDIMEYFTRNPKGEALLQLFKKQEAVCSALNEDIDNVLARLLANKNSSLNDIIRMQDKSNRFSQTIKAIFAEKGESIQVLTENKVIAGSASVEQFEQILRLLKAQNTQNLQFVAIYCRDRIQGCSGGIFGNSPRLHIAVTHFDKPVGEQVTGKICFAQSIFLLSNRFPVTVNKTFYKAPLEDYIIPYREKPLQLGEQQVVVATHETDPETGSVSITRDTFYYTVLP